MAELLSMKSLGIAHELSDTGQYRLQKHSQPADLQLTSMEICSRSWIIAKSLVESSDELKTSAVQ